MYGMPLFPDRETDHFIGDQPRTLEVYRSGGSGKGDAYTVRDDCLREG